MKRRLVRSAVLLALACSAVVLPRAITTPAQTPSTFAAQIAALSEPDGYFDTDNLISNEVSYLDVLPDLQRAGLRGGAYVGVGPDQNFTYIAAIRPSIAFIVDVRRDNLLLHLLFKAIFESARTRAEYLAMLFGRRPPPDANAADFPIARLVSHLDATAPEAASVDELRRRIDSIVRRYGVSLSRDDFATIDRFHKRFVEAGLSLRFHTTGRPPQTYYPTYRQLLLATDPTGRQGHYLASEEAFRFVKSLHARDRVIPVVGNLNGPTALAGIGRLLTDRGERLSVFYTSNVEFYLARDGTFDRFVANLGRLPRTDRTVIIRARFGGGTSRSEVESVNEFLSRTAR